ncbi:MAG: SIS domain-containing protein [Elusimicrobiales bacterium]
MSFTDDFFRRLEAAFRKVEAADGSGAKLSVPEAAEAAYSLMRRAAAAGGKVIIIGNGGSAGIASHISLDLWKNGGIRSLAFNDPSLLTALANDLGTERIFEAPVREFAESRDALIAISSSGKSPNIINAVKAAAEKGCAVITMSGFAPDNPLRGAGAVNFYVPDTGYGFVETVHAGLCHCLVDMAISDRKPRPA